VFTARYALSPYIKQIRFVFKGLKFACDSCIIKCPYFNSKISSGLCHGFCWWGGFCKFVSMTVPTFGSSVVKLGPHPSVINSTLPEQPFTFSSLSRLPSKVCLKIQNWEPANILSKRRKSGCGLSIINDRLLELHCTFSVVSRIPFEGFSWKYTSGNYKHSFQTV
jgi:hypothetical protein